MKQASGIKYYGPIVALLFIITETEACKPIFIYSPGGPPREAEHDPYWRWNYPPPPGWYETEKWPPRPYRVMDYIEFMRQYKKKTQEAKDRAMQQAQDAADKTGDNFSVPDPNNPYNLKPGGIMGPKGPFGPDGPFGDSKIGFGPNGDGGFGDKGRYGHDGRFRPKVNLDRQPYTHDGVYVNYPAAWAAAGIKPANGIHDGVPKDVDEDWPNTWQGFGLPDKGAEPPPMAMSPNTYGTFYDCYEKPVRGDCWGREVRWTYDPYDQECYRFVWGGCGGNRNTFVTYDVCRAICASGSQQRQCKHTYKFEDYIEWPQENLYTSARNRRMNTNSNNTQNVLQKILINKQPARETYATPNIPINKQQTQHQDKETVNPEKQILEISTIKLLSKTDKPPKNSSAEVSSIRKNTKISNISLKNSNVIISNKRAEIETSDINDTFVNNHTNVTMTNSNKTSFNNYSDTTNSTPNTRIKKNPSYDHININSFYVYTNPVNNYTGNITTSNITKNSVNNHTDITSLNNTLFARNDTNITSSNINKTIFHYYTDIINSNNIDIATSHNNKNSTYNRTNIASFYIYANTVNNRTSITTSNITNTSIIVTSGISLSNINKNITNSHASSKINKAAVTNHSLVTSK